MKKKILLLAFLAFCSSVAVTGTLAYYTHEDRAHNVITSGNVAIELVEKTLDGNTEIDFPKDGISGVMPGTSVSKIVAVKNTGSADAWIRVSVDMEIHDQNASSTASNSGKKLPLTIQKENRTIDVITLDVDDANWIYENGYYYYKKPVNPDAFTSTLFENVAFAKEMGNEYQNCKVLIDVSAEAVQAANNPIPTASGSNASDVKGWPGK